MKVLWKMVGVLGITAAVSGFLLAYVDQKTISQIKENQEKAISSAISKLIPEGEKYQLKLLSDYKVYFVFDKGGKLLGYCVLTSGSGYQGEIKMLIGISSDLVTLKGIEILENVETPGLGGKISEEFFKQQFKGKKFSPRLTYVKGKEAENENEVQAITGATVSSSSVVRIINRTLSDVIPLIKKNGE